MPTYDFKFYDGAPFENGFPFGGAGSTITYSGPATADGDITVTDNGSGIDGQTLARDDTATADATINGLTSTGSGARAIRGYLVEDTVTGQQFSVIQLSIDDGDAQGFYTLSEQPLIVGRDYTLLGSSTPPEANSTTAFTYAEYVCFASGTLIETAEGPQPVEDLRVGTRITTLDNGLQKIIWRGQRTLTFGPQNQNQKPIRLARNSLGQGCPNRDLVVSPQHRILLNCGTAGETDEFLGPAKALVTRPKIRVMAGKRNVTYHTLMTERHEVISANGLGAETLYPGPQGMSLFTQQERRDILAAAPSIGPFGIFGYGPFARHVLSCSAIFNLDKVSGVAMQGSQQVDTQASIHAAFGPLLNCNHNSQPQSL